MLSLHTPSPHMISPMRFSYPWSCRKFHSPTRLGLHSSTNCGVAGPILSAPPHWWPNSSRIGHPSTQPKALATSKLKTSVKKPWAKEFVSEKPQETAGPGRVPHVQVLRLLGFLPHPL